MFSLEVSGVSEQEILIEALDHYVDYLRGLDGDHAEDAADAEALRLRVELLSE